MTTSQLTLDGTATGRAPGAIAGAVVLGGLAVAGAVVGANDHGDALGTVGAIVIGAWALLTVFLAVRRPGELLWVFTGFTALAGAGALMNDALVGLVPYVLAAIAITLPDGALRGRRRRSARVALALTTVVAVPFVILLAAADDARALVVVESIVLGLIAVVVYTLHCRNASALDRARLQWVGWGVVVAASCAIAIVLMHELVEWPDEVGVPLAIATIVVPFAIGIARSTGWRCASTGCWCARSKPAGSSCS